jgi:hypothetical protein
MSRSAASAAVALAVFGFVLGGFTTLCPAAAPPPLKVQTTDPAIAGQLASRGARLVGDYGSFQVLEADAAAVATVGTAAVLRPELNLILLNAATLDTRAPGLRMAKAMAGNFTGQRLWLVQFAGPVRPEWRSGLEGDGARVVSYIPQNAYLMYVDSAALSRVQSRAAVAPEIQWQGAYEDAYKIHPKARTVDAQGQPREIGATQFALQFVADPAANESSLALLNQLVLEPVDRIEFAFDYMNVVARIAPESIPLLAARPELVSIMPWFPRHLTGERQDQIIAGNLNASGSSPTGPGYLEWLASKGFTQEQFTTSGFVVDVSDSGIDNGTTSPAHFGLHLGGDVAAAGRVAYARLEGTATAGSTLKGCDGHGTLNTHVIAGYDGLSGFPFVDSLGYHYGLGVCPFVSVGSSVIFDPANFTNPNYRNLMSRAYQSGARISNNSWGGTGTGDYDIDTQIYDGLVRDAQPSNSAVPAAGNQQMVIVFAAGNDGPSAVTMGPPATGKNIIGVGASENVQAIGGADSSGVPDSEADNANDIAPFSSRGPCTDGRHKPDLVAPGTHVSGGVAQVANPGATGQADACFTGDGVSGGVASNFFPPGQQFYTASSGTSHSAPGVSGACALVRQYFINQSMEAPSPAMTKAWLMNSTRYLTGTAANDSLWSESQGMGAIDLGRAFDGVPRVQRDQIPADMFTATGQEQLYTGNIINASKPFRVTLAWSDSPGSTTGASYNNDLDLVVEVGGKTYFGNVFNSAYSATGGLADVRNNVESVILPAGTTGTYSVRVRASNITSDGVPGVGNTLDQDFALVIYNAEAAAVPRVSGAGATLVAESCPPGNGVIDAGETVTVSFGVRNTGLADTTNLVVTLLATNGVFQPGPAQSYGVVPMGGVAVERQFSFTAVGTCGTVIQPTLLLQDAGTTVGLVNSRFILGTYNASEIFSQNFDSVTVPAMPSGWTKLTSLGGVSPATTNTLADSAPNSLKFSEPDVRGEALIISPAIPIATPSAQITFAVSYDTEVDPAASTLGYDGTVLDIKVGSSNFVDIISAGGSFVTSPYTRQLDTTGDNPLKGRQAWSGASGGFVPVVINLPAAAAGKNIQFKWRFGTDEGNFYGGTGFYVDSIKVIDGSYSCCQVPLNDAGIVTISRTPSGQALSVESTTGVTYTLQYKSSLSDPQWTPITPSVVGTGGIIVLTDSTPGLESRFYRVAAHR